MADKKDRPATGNPLANMGLDEIVRGITSGDAVGKPAGTRTKGTGKRAGSGAGRFETNLDKYTGVSGQGAAIWLPKEVKKHLELIRANADRNIPLRSLAAAIIMTYIEENESKFEDL